MGILSVVEDLGIPNFQKYLISLQISHISRPLNTKIKGKILQSRTTKQIIPLIQTKFV